VTDAELPDDVIALVYGPVSTMAHVELLLALRAADPRPRVADALATETHAVSPEATRQALAELVAARLASHAPDDEWVYAPRAPWSRDAVDQLARMYHERPVTLVRALYSRPARPPRSFADTFRPRPTD